MTVVILAIAFIKIRLVGRHFMEIREVPVVLGQLFDLWALSVGGIVVTLYYQV